MFETKISSKGQLVIPKFWRDELGLKPGDTIVMNKVDSKIVIMLKPADPLKRLEKIGKELSIKARKEIERE